MIKEFKNLVLTKTDHKKERTLDLLKRSLPEGVHPALKNYRLFFEELGEDCSKLKVGMMTDDLRKMAGKYISRKRCHTNAMTLTAMHHSFLFYYGFVDAVTVGYNKSAYHQTEQHSFNVHVSGDKKIVLDPTISMINLRKGAEVLHTGKNYFGVNIPYEVLDRIVNEHPGKKGCILNISHHLKENVFPSEEKTRAFINEIREAVAASQA